MISRSLISLQALLLFSIFAISMSSCLKELDPLPEPAYARLEITDAPIDDPNVSGVFITVKDVKVNGVSWKGFEGKTTFDLLAYQNGETRLLGEGNIDAGTYSEIVLVLDTETDALGNSPGCYVKDQQGTKRKLEGSGELTLKAKGSLVTKAADTTVAVIDMDLRKSIVYRSGSTTEFEFVTNAELQTAVRLLDKANVGKIAGNCSDGVSASDKIIAYAYLKGTYNENEKFPQGTSQVQFKNAVTSAVVADNGDYSLSFLESGMYEVYFISYQEGAGSKLLVKGELQVNLLDATLNLLQLNVTAKTTINLDVVVTGILFF